MAPTREMKPSYFYVLWCKDRSFYAGYTTDLKRREAEHNEGIGAKYTRPKNRRPLKMIYAETFETRSEATKAEAAFKKLTRPQKENYLKENGVPFPLAKSDPCVVKEVV
jgi:putative endonuclease